MKHSLSFFLRYYLFWLAFFLFFKAFFLLYNNQLLETLPASDILGIFTHGIIMDLSAAGYLSFIPGLLATVGLVFFPLVSRSIIKYYSLLLIIILVLMGLGDAGLYEEWGTRINSQIILYLKNPGGMYAAMSLFQIIALIVLWVSLSVIWFIGIRWICSTSGFSKSNWKSIPVMLLLTAALVLPIRGGLNTSPLNYSNVYFSQNLDANQSAYNFFWNFMYSMGQTKFNRQLVNYMPEKEAKQIVDSYSDSITNYPVYINSNGKPVNIVVVFLESFSNKLIAPAGGLPDATPRLNQLCNEGILFSEFYATGIRSDKGMCAFLGGYPSVMNETTILATPEKMSRLYYFPKKFKEQGYNLSFYYGGDVNFYNTRTALIQSGFNHIVDNTNYPKQISSLQKWGVPDEYLYARMYNEITQQKEPFFSMVYNISSHEPFDIPNYHKIKGEEKKYKYLNSIAYSDSCLGNFIDSLKASPLWENTLVVITADHCSSLPDPTNVQKPLNYRIPLIWIGGVIDTSFVCTNIAMQNDFGPTLVQQMGLNDTIPKFSKNIFGKRHYAFYFRDIGWGFVAPGINLFENINEGTEKIFLKETDDDWDSQLVFAKAYVQYLHDDFRK